MRFLTTILHFLFICPTAYSTFVPLKSVEKFSGERVAGSFIIKLKDGASRHSLIKTIGVNVSHEWDVAFNGFAGKLSDVTLNALRASLDVESIMEDGIMSIVSSEVTDNASDTSVLAVQSDAPWGIARLSSNTRLASLDATALNFQFAHDPSAGQGIDVYVVDTGISVTHVDFGGRARWGATFGPYASADGNGHGTHVAGTIAGQRFGVAKSANVIAVKVLSDAGSGTVSDIISGINFVATSARTTGRPSVINMSIGGAASTAFDNAVSSVILQGIHVVAAAGNSNTDAGGSSPGRLPAVLTIGATNIADARTSASNFGSVVDVFAPGQDITSTWIGDNSAFQRISGTSMATAHVTGVVAYFLYTDGNLSPGAVSNLVIERSLKDVLTNIPPGTPNRLAHIPT